MSVDLLARRAAQDVDRILQLHFLGRVAVDPQNLVAGKDACFRRRRVFHRRDHGEQSVFYRDFDAEPVEAAARIVLHVLEVVRIHELAVRIERREHAFHRRVNQVVVAGLFAIDVILPDELDRFRENRNLRITGIFLLAGRADGVEAEPEQDEDENETGNGDEQEAALHWLAISFA